METQKVKERLIVKNFGPLKDVDLVIDDLIVLIGPQASGKSTLAKLVYFFRQFPSTFISLLVPAAQKNQTKDIREVIDLYHSFRPIFANIYERIFGKSNSIKNAEATYYLSAGGSIKLLVSQNGDLTYDLSNDLSKELLNNYLKYKNAIHSPNQHEAYFKERGIIQDFTFTTDYFVQQIESLFGIADKNFYIPDGRLILSLMDEVGNLQISEKSLNPIQTNYLYKLNDYRRIPSMLNEYRRLTEQGKTNELSDADVGTLISHSDSILKGKYSFTPATGERIYHTDDEFVEIQHASSGQKESVWLLQLLFWFTVEKKKYFTFIEEPEAHLFPEAQAQVVELMAAYLNQPNHRLMVTTHSPYILQTFNSLAYAGKMGALHPEEVKKLVPELFWIAPGKMAAYYVENGEITNIIDDEMKLIENQKLDTISSKNVGLFHELVKLEDDYGKYGEGDNE